MESTTKPRIGISHVSAGRIETYGDGWGVRVKGNEDTLIIGSDGQGLTVSEAEAVLNQLDAYVAGSN